MGNRERLIALSLKYEGNYTKIKEAIKNKEEVTEIEYDKCITILDDDYPRALLDLKMPPFVLFYKGNKELLKENAISIVGSRLACDYALRSTKELVNHYNDFVVISGLAKGIDGLAHRYANKSIGVLGCGIDYIYPYENLDLFLKLEKDGLIISEYPGLVKPLGYHFPFRNRIIAALGDCLYVMQSSEKSGTVTTINEALELNKDIKVLPYDIHNECGKYNNKLINDGALLIEENELKIDNIKVDV